MADLEANMMHFQLMHESLARFSESFASFLYGLNMNAFCVDFQEGPIAESFRRARQHDESTANSGNFAKQCCCLGMIRLMENITQHRFAHRKS
ncbi:DASH complex subunit dam1 [Colletotrichum trifolii]|uniref:DASH complex subunit DAM1 n=1 Tax=Colletotrichum trifolii TaxID=5466 RepID=A0A4R8R633_COLTR|nr:DASH complex subunit dam1 [Colletotrichum trifolii]